MDPESAISSQPGVFITNVDSRALPQVGIRMPRAGNRTPQVVLVLVQTRKSMDSLWF